MRDEMLWDRETRGRELYMEMLRGQEQNTQKEMRKATRRLKKARFDETCVATPYLPDVLACC